jgi:hypothetical protein
MLALMCLCFGASSAAAHDIHESTARVTFRAGHVEVRLRLDPLSLMDASDPGAGPPVPAGMLALVDPEAYEAVATEALLRLIAETALTLDGRPQPLTLTSRPATGSWSSLAQRAIMAHEVDPTAPPLQVELVLEARLTARPANAALAFPEVLGPVLVTWLEPEQSYARPGSVSRYGLSVRPTPTLPPAATRRPLETVRR